MRDLVNQQKYILREDEIATGDNPVSIHITNHTATLNLTEGKEVSGLFWEKSRIILNSIHH